MRKKELVSDNLNSQQWLFILTGQIVTRRTVGSLCCKHAGYYLFETLARILNTFRLHHLFVGVINKLTQARQGGRKAGYVSVLSSDVDGGDFI